ncbi:HIRAN domain-containing protein [Thiocapsa roseopersicina]|uniref:HIRAN domain-containing protein n=1 Tax=Thiocapsa roseopersicina TaxID=1058 RepID=A0A1H2VIT0_THIRO|nr:HIRAN domain-containing protein [Thiocapsa roseopersicina]SDW68251.1 HIRAN domain-containing protein [Thiocapsa roseopersicina]
MSHRKRSATNVPEPSLDEAIIGRHLVIQRSRLAGFRHHEAPAVLPVLRAGSPLTLSAERDNPYDGDAVAIHWQGHMLGYLPRDENLVVARLLARQRRMSARVRRLDPDAEHNQRLQIEILLH